MKAISVRQPWANAIACGAKTVENRSAHFTKRYRGLVAIHASSQWSDRGALDPRIRALDLNPDFRFGEVVAIAHLVDAHQDSGCCEPWGEHSYARADGSHELNPTHLILEDIHRVQAHVSLPGRLGLWNLPPLIVAELEIANV